jgi:predicted ATP-dependent endonuclease of OLD family
LAAFDDLLEEVTKDMDSAMVAKLAPMTFEEAKQLFDEFDHKYEKSEKEFLNLIVLQAKTNGSEAIFMLKKYFLANLMA